MFKKEMKAKLEAVFKFKKTTFDAYSQEYEQDVLFVEIHDCKESVKTDSVAMRITGDLVYFSQVDKIKYGQMIKLIELAKADDKNSFFFYDIDKQNVSSQARLIDIAERRISFQYLYKGQFDPDKGVITSLNMDCCNN